MRCPLEGNWLKLRRASGLCEDACLVGDGLDEELCLLSEFLSHLESTLLRSLLFSQSLLMSLVFFLSLSCIVSAYLSSLLSSDFGGYIDSVRTVPLLFEIFLN